MENYQNVRQAEAHSAREAERPSLVQFEEKEAQEVSLLFYGRLQRRGTQNLLAGTNSI